MIRNLLTGAVALFILPAANAGELNISLSEDLAQKISEEYGAKEGDYLIRRVTEKVGTVLNGSFDGLGDVNIIIEDAQPNRPTLKQMNAKPGLSFESFSIGGAKFSGEVYDQTGALLVSLDNKYYSNDLRWAQYSATWADAMRSADFFARKLDKAVTAAQSDGAGS